MNKEQACERLIREVHSFIEGNDIDFIFDSDWKTWLLSLLFPSISKRLTWLNYSMHQIGNALDQVKKAYEKPAG